MKRRCVRAIRIGLAAGLACCVWSLVGAEVSTNRTDDGRRVSTLLMDYVLSITDGADPIPQVRWQAYRRISSKRLLNEEGAIRPDGRPDVVFHPLSGWPFVVWAYNNGTDHDIACAAWTGESWSETHFLTSSIENEVDPRAFIAADGSVFVVWAVEGEDPRVMLASVHPPTVEWRLPVRVSARGEKVHRPTVAAAKGALWVAYEREVQQDALTRRGVVVKRRGNGGDFVATFGALASRDGVLDPLLHVRGEQLWLDWIHRFDRFAWVTFQDGRWSEIAVHPWQDGSWVGIESVRKDIQRRIPFPSADIEPHDTVP